MNIPWINAGKFRYFFSVYCYWHTKKRIVNKYALKEIRIVLRRIAVGLLFTEWEAGNVSSTNSSTLFWKLNLQQQHTHPENVYTGKTYRQRSWILIVKRCSWAKSFLNLPETFLVKLSQKVYRTHATCAYIFKIVSLLIILFLFIYFLAQQSVLCLLRQILAIKAENV